MDDFLCKIWRFFANLFTRILELVVAAIRSIADVIIDVVDGVLGGGIGSMLLWIGGGVLLYFLLTADKEEDRKADGTIPTQFDSASIGVIT